MLKIKKQKKREIHIYPPEYKGCPPEVRSADFYKKVIRPADVDNTSEKLLSYGFPDVLSTVIMPNRQMAQTGGDTENLL